MNQVKICLVGAGRAGMVRALNFRQRIAETQLVAIVDTELARAHRQAKKLGVNLFFDSIEAALVEPLSCCLNAQQVCSLQPGETVVIMGAEPLGLMHLYWPATAARDK